MLSRFKDEQYQAGNAKWVANLMHLHKPGRIYAEHLANVAARLTGAPVVGSAQENRFNSRVFVWGLSEAIRTNSGMPFGLPSPLPKYILCSNHSGHRVLAYSDHLMMLFTSCGHTLSADRKEHLDSLARFVVFAEKCPRSSVLICYSLLWDQSLSSQHWDISTLVTSPNNHGRCVMDRTLCYNSLSPRVHHGTPTLDLHGRENVSVIGRSGEVVELISKMEIKTFERNYQAIHFDAIFSEQSEVQEAEQNKGEEGLNVNAQNQTLDHIHSASGECVNEDESGETATKEGGGNGNGNGKSKSSAELPFQRGLVDRLMADRKKDQTEIARLQLEIKQMQSSEEERNELWREGELKEMESQRKALKIETDLQGKRTKEATQKLVEMQRNVQQMASEVSQHQNENKRLCVRIKEMTRTHERQMAVANSQSSTHMSKIKSLEDDLARSQSHQDKQVKAVEECWKAKIEEAKAEKGLKVLQVQEKNRVITQLGQNLENKDNEIASLKREVKEDRERQKQQTLDENELRNELRNALVRIVEVEALLETKTTEVEKLTVKSKATNKQLQKERAKTASLESEALKATLGIGQKNETATIGTSTSMDGIANDFINHDLYVHVQTQTDEESTDGKEEDTKSTEQEPASIAEVFEKATTATDTQTDATESTLPTHHDTPSAQGDNTPLLSNILPTPKFSDSQFPMPTLDVVEFACKSAQAALDNLVSVSKLVGQNKQLYITTIPPPSSPPVTLPGMITTPTQNRAQ